MKAFWMSGKASLRAQIEAIDRSQAVIEFALDGTIVSANDNFLSVMGYRLEEIRGQHHRLFVDEAYARSAEYRSVWEKLGRGEFHQGQFKRLGKNGRDVWIQATYSPILGPDGRPLKVVKYASDVTEQVEAQRRMKEGVDAMLRVVSAAAAGDLTGDLPLDGDDAVGRMAAGLRALIGSLRETISHIAGVVNRVAATSTEISASTEQLAAGSQEQSTQADEVAAAVEQMVRTIVENARNATAAATGAEQSGHAARQGAAVVTQTVEKIRRIASVVAASASPPTRSARSYRSSTRSRTRRTCWRSTRLSKPPGQANRAAASPSWRTRCASSPNATKEIAQMIRTIQMETRQAVAAMQQGTAEVEDGIALADRAGASLQEIVARAQEMLDGVTQIAAASEEQSSTSEQIGRSVVAISTVSNESARGVSQIATAVDGLSRLSADLQRLVWRFRLDAADGPYPETRPGLSGDGSGRHGLPIPL